MTTWYDIEMRGRRLEALYKQMNSVTERLFKEASGSEEGLDDPKFELAMSYIDRMLKIEATIKPYIEDYVGLKKMVKEYESRENRVSPITK